MREYKRPVVMVNEEVAEGVYAASGDCYIASGRIVQKPDNGNRRYVVQLEAVHDVADGHHSTEQQLEVIFNQPVTYCHSGATRCTGDGSTRLVLYYDYHNNAGPENIGLGNLEVESELGLALMSVRMIYCNMECGMHN